MFHEFEQYISESLPSQYLQGIFWKDFRMSRDVQGGKFGSATCACGYEKLGSKISLFAIPWKRCVNKSITVVVPHIYYLSARMHAVKIVF
jgi:hypothetical protein